MTVKCRHLGRLCSGRVTAEYYSSDKPRGFILCEKKHGWKRATTKRKFCHFCREVVSAFSSVARVKHFVNVLLHCIVVNNLKRSSSATCKMISNMSTLPPQPPGKMCAVTHVAHESLQNRQQLWMCWLDTFFQPYINFLCGHNAPTLRRSTQLRKRKEMMCGGLDS